MSNIATITLSKFNHNNEDQLSIGFKFSESTKAIVKAIEGVKWSATHRTFYVSFSKDAINTLYHYFKSNGYYVDYSSLLQPTEKTYQPIVKLKPSSSMATMFTALPIQYKDLLRAYTGFLTGKRLSKSTIRSYGYFVLRFMDFYNPKPIDAIEKKRHRPIF